MNRVPVAGFNAQPVQLAMSGDDWSSERDRRAQARAETHRHTCGLAMSRKLLVAAEALQAYLRACNACQDGSGDEKTGVCDCRARLIGELTEYAYFVMSRDR